MPVRRIMLTARPRPWNSSRDFIMRRYGLLAALIAGALLLCGIAPAAAQGCGGTNPNCVVPTAPPGTSNNQAASTAFVQNSGTGSGTSIMAFGAVADGATDAGPAINSCIAAVPKLDCVVPPSQLGFFINTTVQNTGSLRGTVVNFDNPAPSTSFSGSSWLLCSASVSPCVQNGGSSLPNLGVSAQFDNIIVSRVSGTPTAGTIGVQWNGGYNPHSQNVYVFNHDICYKWFASGVSGISFIGVDMHLANCGAHFFVFDGWPEAHITGGRAGADGSGGYNSTDLVLFTNTSCSSAGCGPNTITFDNYNFLPNGGFPTCGINFANFTNAPTSVINTEYKFTNTHIEWHTSGGTGVICSDSTVTGIQGVYMDHVVTAMGSASVPMFALNAATSLTQWFIHDSNFNGCSNITLAPTPASGPSFSDVHFSRIFGCNTASFTSNGRSGNRLTLSEDNWGSSLTVSGAFDWLSSFNDVYSALTDSATGHVAWSNPQQQSWTPALAFGGVSTGITYGTQFGSFSRTADGGWIAAFEVDITAVGSATGAATITGLPKTCSNTATNRAAAGVAAYYNGMKTGATTTFAAGYPVHFRLSSTNIQIDTTGTNTPFGESQLQNDNFSATSGLAGTIKCASTP